MDKSKLVEKFRRIRRGVRGKLSVEGINDEISSSRKAKSTY